MSIRWKVVTENRESVIVYGELARKYCKDEIVTADPRTMGLMTFDTKRHAENFAGTSGWQVLKVQSIGEGIKPKLLTSCRASVNIIEWYAYSNISNLTPPPGTICYKRVKVLE